MYTFFTLFLHLNFSLTLYGKLFNHTSNYNAISTIAQERISAHLAKIAK